MNLFISGTWQSYPPTIFLILNTRKYATTLGTNELQDYLKKSLIHVNRD